MPQMDNLILKDGSATPQDLLFVPQDCNSEVATWVRNPLGRSIGALLASLSLKMGRNGESNKVTAKVVNPIIETISGNVNGIVAAPQIAYTCLGKCEFVFPVRSTDQERRDTKALMHSMIESAYVAAATEWYLKTY